MTEYVITTDTIIAGRIAYPRVISLPITIVDKGDFETPPKNAIKIIKHAIKHNLEYVLQKPEPEIHVTDLADSSVNLEIMVWYHREHWGKIYPQLRDVIKSSLDANGIEIPFPQRVVEIHDN